MRQYFYLLVLCLMFYVKQTLCMKRVTTVASLSLAFSNVTILHVKLVNSLQTVYVSMKDTDGYPKIKSYTLSGSSFIQQKIYAEPTHTVYPDNIMLFVYNTIPMVIGIQSTNLNFSVCYMGNATCMPNTYTVNQTVSGYLQSMTQKIVIYVGSLGTIYWVNASTFPTAGYKTPMLLGLIGTPAAVLSPNQNYAAVGVSGENKVYLLELVNKTLLYTFTLNAVDTRIITWSNNSGRIFVVTPNQGIIYELNITSPYTVKTYRYQTTSTVTAYHAQFLGYTDEVVIWTYKNNRSVIQMYSFHLFNYRNFHVEKYNTTANITGTSCDNSTKEYYAEWTTNQVYIKKIEAFCNNEGGFYGDFYDQCQGKCVGCLNIFCGGFCNTYGCGSSCTTYTSLLPATLPISVYNMTTVPNVTVTNATNTTVTNTTVVNSTVTNSTVTNTTVADTTTNKTTNTTANNTAADPTLNTTGTNTTIVTNVTANTTIVANTTINDTVASNTTVNNSTVTNTTVGNATDNSTETVNTTLTTNSTANVTVNNTTTNNTTVPQNINSNTNETNWNETNTTETNPVPPPIITPPDQTDPNQDSQELSGLYKNFQILLNNTLRSDVLQDLNSVPGGRRFLRPIFTFFGNLDDFWLYIYHPRNYEFVITSTFQSIQSLQNEKWTLLPYETLWSHVGIDLSHLKQTFSEKLPYTSEKFTTIEDNSSGFFINTANFLLSNMLITVAMFLVGRFLFYLLFNFKVSIFFRQYSFWPYLMMIIMDGNLQYASYLVAFQLRWLVYFNFFYKLMAVWILINFFIMVLFAIACYYIFRYIYGELAKYFFDNSQNSNQGAFYLMAQSGLRNILLGFVHYIDFQVYSHKISILVFLEVAFLTFGLKVIGISNIFQHKINAWINFIAGFLRILVISTFYFEQNVSNESDITYTSPLFVHLIGIYILIGLLAIIIELAKLVLGIFGFLKPKQFDKLNQQQEVHQIILKNNKRLKITVINPQKNPQKQKAKAVKIQTTHTKSYLYHDKFEELQEITQSNDKKNNQQIDFDRKYDKQMTYKSRIKKKFALENQKQKIKESNRTYFELKESKNRTSFNQNRDGNGKAKAAKTMKMNFKKTGIELGQF